MLLTSGILLLALLGRVEPTKISLKQVGYAAPPPAYYQAPPPPLQLQQQQQTLLESAPVASEPVLSGVKGAAAAPAVPLAAVPQQPLIARQPLPLFSVPQSLAYVIIRPIQHQPIQYQYLEPMRQYNKVVYAAPPAIIQQQQQQQQETFQQQQYPTKGGEEQRIVGQQQVEQLPTKGAPEPVRQESGFVEQSQVLESQPAPLPPAQSSSVVLVPIVPPPKFGKFLKLKNSFDRLAAQAKSKLTLGSSYQVIGEEYIHPAPVGGAVQAAPAAPLEQQKVLQQNTQEIALTQQEQENIREAEQQEQQQSFEPQQQEEIAPSKGQQQQQQQQQQLPAEHRDVEKGGLQASKQQQSDFKRRTFTSSS